MKKLITICLAMVLSMPMLTSQNYIGDQSEVDKILKLAKEFSTFVMASDYDAIVNCYTEDAKIFPSNSDIIEGKEGIRSYWVLPEGMKTTYHKLEPVEIKILGDEAYDYGYYEGTSLRPNGESSNWRGKYVVVWRKVDDSWKMYLDIWNGIAQ